MKTSYWAAYRDITDFPRGEIELMKAPQPDVKRVRPGIIPAMDGYPAVHVQWWQFTFEEEALHLVTYAEEEIGQAKAREIAEKALAQHKEQVAEASR
jgi:hypothetical protein